MKKSSKIFNENMKLLIENYPQISKRINQLDYSDKLTVDVLEAKDKNKCIIVKSEDKKFYINSQYNPIKEATRWVHSIDFQNEKIFIVFGFGAGYRIKELVKELNSENKVIVIEPSINILAKVLENIDCTDIISRSNVKLLIGQSVDEFEKILWDEIEWSEVDNICIKVIPNYDKLFLSEYSKFIEIINEIIRDKKLAKNTILHFSEEWQKNIILNIPHLLHSADVSSFFYKFEHIPTIIVSAGPSLNKNVHLLKKAEKNAIIICVGTALKTLIQNNIIPHFVITVDGGKNNYRHFKDISYSNIPLVYSIKTYPSILDKHKGKKIAFIIPDGSTDKILKEINIELGTLGCGGSVSNSAFDFAIKLGGNPIIFVGQDLAYTDNKTHADGTVYEKNQINEIKNLIETEDIFGNKVYTDLTLLAFKKWFEGEIKKYTKEKIVINATEGGLKIEGTINMDLEKCLALWCQNSIEITHKINSILDENCFYSQIRIDNLVKTIEFFKKEIQFLIIDIKKGISLARMALNRYKVKNDISNILLQLDLINKKINTKIKDLYITHIIVQPIIYKFNNIKNNLSDNDVVEKLKQSQFLYIELVNSFKSLAEILNESLIKLSNYR